MAITKKYVANAPLFIGRARAANPGDEVPEDNVERFGWGDLVDVIEIHDEAELDVAETEQTPAEGEQLGGLEYGADAVPIPPASDDAAGEGAGVGEPAGDEPVEQPVEVPAEQPAPAAKTRSKAKA